MKTSLVSTAAVTRAIDSSKDASIYQNQLANDLQKLLETGMDTLSRLRSHHVELYMSANNLEMTMSEVVDNPQTLELPTDESLESVNQHLCFENERLARALRDLYTLIQVKLHPMTDYASDLKDNMNSVAAVEIDTDSIEGSFYSGSITIDRADFDTDMDDLSRDLKNGLQDITDKHSELKRLSMAILDNALGSLTVNTDAGTVAINTYIDANIDSLDKVFDEMESQIVGDTIPNGCRVGILTDVQLNHV